MTKKDLIEKVSRTVSHLPEEIVVKGVDLFFCSISQALIEKRRIELRGFGNFFLKHRQAYVGLNPQTQEKINVLPRWAVFFKVSSLLKKELIEPAKQEKMGLFSMICRDLKILKRSS